MNEKSKTAAEALADEYLRRLRDVVCARLHLIGHQLEGAEPHALREQLSECCRRDFHRLAASVAAVLDAIHAIRSGGADAERALTAISQCGNARESD